MLLATRLGASLTGDELRSLRLAVSRSAHQAVIPHAHEVRLRHLGLVREAEGGLCPTDKGWMALASRSFAAA
jgi:hypothetical protein